MSVDLSLWLSHLINVLTISDFLYLIPCSRLINNVFPFEFSIFQHLFKARITFHHSLLLTIDNFSYIIMININSNCRTMSIFPNIFKSLVHHHAHSLFLKNWYVMDDIFYCGFTIIIFRGRWFLIEDQQTLDWLDVVSYIRLSRLNCVCSITLRRSIDIRNVF